jgi:putative transposase
MFMYRLYPTKEQKRLLNRQLEACRWLYNHLLAERRDAWTHRQESLRLYDQHAILPALKAERPSLAEVQSQVLQNVAVRIDLPFQAFFRRVRAGAKEPGYPRFRGVGRYDSLTESGQKAPGREPGEAWPLALRGRRPYAVTRDRRKTVKYRLYPTQQPQRLLEHQREEGRWLDHHWLARRRDGWEQRQESMRL